MPTAFLNAKMYWGRLPPNLVARPRLLDKLDRGLEAGHALTLVSAPAGYGKTTLLHEWLYAKDEGRVAWLTLDEADNDPADFWAYVVLALQAIDDELGETELAQLRSPQPPPLELILRSLLNEIDSLRDRTILVLDDYHTIREPIIHESVISFLEHLPSTVHLVLSTRADPPLPLPRLRAKRLLTEVRASDLRFTPDEALTLLNECNRLSLPAEHVTAITEQTEGWIAGLQLAALSLEGRDPDGRARLVANLARQQFILDYLTDEVLCLQSEPVQTFLLQTSILNQLTGPLCNAVTGRSNGHTLLENLNRANMFLVPLDTERNWYRYHHLFAGLLQARLRESRPGEVNSLHARAAEWCEANGLAAEAIQHALAIGDPERVGQLIKRVARRMFVGSEIRMLLGWIEALPEDYISADPHLSMIYAWALLATSHMDTVNTHLQDVERALGFVADGSQEHQGLPPTIRGALAEVLCIRSNLPLHSRDPLMVLKLSEQSRGYLAEDVQRGLFQPRLSMEAILAFNRGVAHELLGDVKTAEGKFDEVLATEPRDGHMAHLAGGHLVQLLIVQGRLNEAAELCREALRPTSGGPSQVTPFSGLAHAELGMILCEWNELEEAESHLRHGLELALPWSNLEALLLAYSGLARIQAARGDYERALRSWEELRRVAQDVKAPWGVALADAHRANLWARQGKRAAARRWSRRAAIANQETIPYMQEAEGLVLARVLTALGDCEHVQVLLRTMERSAEAGGRRGRRIEILILQALAAQAQGQTAQALSNLKASLALSEPDGYVRIYLDEGEPIARLLQQVALHDPTEEYAAKLLLEFEKTRGEGAPGEGQASSVPSDFPDRLTGRELEVLRLLADGLSNREIAQKLYLSPNTLRVHTYNIYSKLDVHGRMQAVLKARQLGLLPPSH